MAAIDPVAFLRATAPFHALPQELFDEAARAVDVAYHPAGTPARARGRRAARSTSTSSARARCASSATGRSCRSSRRGRPSATPRSSRARRRSTSSSTRTSSPTACRPRRSASCCATPPSRRHFAVGPRRAAQGEPATRRPVATFRSDLSRQVEQLVRRPAAWVDAGATVGDAARGHARASASPRCSCAASRPGIVTDRDFRNRVLAEDLGPETPLAARPLAAAPDGPRLHPDLRGVDAPARRRGCTTCRWSATAPSSASSPRATSSASPRRGRSRCCAASSGSTGASSLPGYGAKVAEMASALVAGRLDVAVIAGFVARLNDALAPPHRALGARTSSARRRRPSPGSPSGRRGAWSRRSSPTRTTPSSTPTRGPRAREWYQALAERVNADLEAAGFPRCAGGYMATRWHGPLSEWTAPLRRLDRLAPGRRRCSRPPSSSTTAASTGTSTSRRSTRSWPSRRRSRPSSASSRGRP